MAAEWSFRLEGDKIIATETWRLDDPELPFIVPDWLPNRAEIVEWIDGAEYLGTDYPMSELEFCEYFGSDNLP